MLDGEWNCSECGEHTPTPEEEWDAYSDHLYEKERDRKLEEGA